MNCIGVDLGKVHLQICEISAEGVVWEKRIRTEHTRIVEVFGSRMRGRVLMEACTDSEWVARLLEGLGFEVIVADPNFAPMYAQRSRRVKTDRRDALALAEACRVGAYRPAHRTSDPRRHVRGLLAVRESLVRTRTRWILLVRDLLRREGLGVRSGHAESFARRVREVVVPDHLREEVDPLLDLLAPVNAQLKQLDLQRGDHGTVAFMTEHLARVRLQGHAQRHDFVWARPTRQTVHLEVRRLTAESVPVRHAAHRHSCGVLAIELRFYAFHVGSLAAGEVDPLCATGAAAGRGGFGAGTIAFCLDGRLCEGRRRPRGLGRQPFFGNATRAELNRGVGGGQGTPAQTLEFRHQRHRHVSAPTTDDKETGSRVQGWHHVSSRRCRSLALWGAAASWHTSSVRQAGQHVVIVPSGRGSISHLELSSSDRSSIKATNPHLLQVSITLDTVRSFLEQVHWGSA